MNSARHSSNPTARLLRVFVYGTLKEGYANHKRLCQDHSGICSASLPGRITDRPEGFPTLFVPPVSIIGYGSHDSQADLNLQLAAELSSPPDLNDLAKTPWSMILGQALCFQDHGSRLSALDNLEDFNPDGRCYYCRVLLWVLCDGQPKPCWVYISPHNNRFAKLLKAQTT